MIGHSDLDSLDEEQAPVIQALFERRHAISDLPDDMEKVETWEDFIVDCERAQFPHLIASARFDQYTTLSNGGRVPEALETYVKLMQVIHRHGDLIARDNVDLFLGSVATVTVTAIGDPSVPMARIVRMIDLVEQEVSARSMDIAGVYFARAEVACASGDARGTATWLERWRAESSDQWRADDPAVIQMEIPLIARFDPRHAGLVLDQRFRAMGIDYARMVTPEFDAEAFANLFALRAFLAERTGDAALAEHVTRYLLERVGARRLVDYAVPDYLARIFEGRPQSSLLVVDHTLARIEFGGSDWEIVAALARSRILFDPDSDEGWLLKAVAEEAAQAHDARGSTTVHTRELNDFWWQGLPERAAPPVVFDAEVWDDIDERSEIILASGWLRRVPMVGGEEPPISMRDRYLALLMGTMDILSADTDAEADALAQRLWLRAERYKSPSTRYAVALLSSMRAGQKGDSVAFVSLYRSAQAVLLEGDPGLPGHFRAAGENGFGAIVALALGSPQVTWNDINAMVETEEHLRRANNRPLSHVYLARAEVAHHLGQGEAFQAAIGELRSSLEAESEVLDRIDLDLALVDLLAYVARDFARSIAEWVEAAGDAVQARAAQAWLLWFKAGAPGTAAEVERLLDSVERDVSEFVSLPDWVLLESAAPESRLEIAEALLENNDPLTDDDLHLIAALGATISAFAPGDPRGPQLRERAFAIGAALDQRNGFARWRERAELWFNDALSHGGGARRG